MSLSADQAAAEAAFVDFLETDATVFALLGYAGTGKSFMEAYLLQNYILNPKHVRDPNELWTSNVTEVLIAAPTHKAINISRRFFDEIDLEYELGYDKFHHRFGTPVTGTTAQLLGIRPIIGDDQTADKMEFGTGGQGMIEQVGDVGWIVIDEVSMLSANHMKRLEQLAENIGARILIIGDPGQLPPVEAEAIDFDAITHKAVLSQIMRQASDSAIPHLARAIRDQEDWTVITGPGVDHFENPAGAFIDELVAPPEDERLRQVFIAYRNARVNAVQQAACHKVYGHGRLEIRTGEVLTANTPLIMPGARIPVTLCNNGDVLVVDELGEKGIWGAQVRMKRARTGKTFVTEYLNEVELGDPSHPYNVELKRRESEAKQLQALFKRGDRTVDPSRRSAWQKFFELKKSTVLSASHPFAITSHKSQGSTYRSAFVDATDMAPFDHRALYVGATRPSEELVIG